MHDEETIWHNYCAVNPDHCFLYERNSDEQGEYESCQGK